jgi:hypothetical protein
MSCIVGLFWFVSGFVTAGSGLALALGFVKNNLNCDFKIRKKNGS